MTLLGSHVAWFCLSVYIFETCRVSMIRSMVFGSTCNENWCYLIFTFRNKDLNSAFTGNMALLAQHNACKVKNRGRFGSATTFYADGYFQKHLKSGRRNFSKSRGSFVCCSLVSSISELSNARVIYCVAPAMGHNKVWWNIRF